MKPALMFPAAIALFCSSMLAAQSNIKQEKSPKVVAQEFWTLETQGTRLTNSGWNQMSGFFSAQPSAAPKQKDIFIVAGSFQVASVKGTANEAEVYVICRILGRLDSSLQLVRPSVDVPGSSGWGGINYNLVRTDKRWEFSPDGSALKQVTGPPKWRLRDFQPALYLNVSTAMHYLLEMRSQATDLTVKKNAEMTAAALLRLNANPQAFAANPPQRRPQSPAPRH